MCQALSHEAMRNSTVSPFTPFSECFYDQTYTKNAEFHQVQAYTQNKPAVQDVCECPSGRIHVGELHSRNYSLCNSSRAGCLGGDEEST